MSFDAGALPRVSIASLGGTVTMAGSADSAGLVPTLDAADILASAPAAREVADLRATTLTRKPGASLRFEDVLSALDWAREQVDGGADGIVLLQGTDTLEEVSYLLDLLWDRPQPLVVTGAMRAPSQLGADGPANLLGAIVVAASAQARDRGALVVINDVVHPAARVRKRDSVAMDAFHSGPFGPLGRIIEYRAVLANQRARPAPLRVPATAVTVDLVEMTLGDSGRLIRSAVDHGSDGLVISGLGAGHVPADALDAVAAAVSSVPVVLANRTGAGPVLDRTYAFAGSELDLQQRGLISAGWLDARKARLLLWVALGNGMARSDIGALFETHARLP